MKQSINSYEFHRAFESMRPDNFTYEGREALFEYLEQYEEDTGEEIELDVIALCCFYSEMTMEEVINDYIYSERKHGDPIIYDQDAYDAMFGMCDSERHEFILDWLNDRTMVIEVDNGSFIVQAF